MSSRKETLDLTKRFAACVRNVALHTGDHRLVDELESSIEENERQHRALGRRLVGAAATRGRFSVAAAVDYFVARTIAEALAKWSTERPISDLVGLRDDYVKAAILVADGRFRGQMLLALEAEFPDAGGLKPLCDAVAALDYAEMMK